MNFEEAVVALNNGQKITRKGRNGKHMNLYLVKSDSIQPEVCVGWASSRHDRQATDWELVKEE